MPINLPDMGIEPDSTIEMEIINPADGSPLRDKDGKIAFVRVVGRNSQEWRQAEKSNTMRMQRTKTSFTDPDTSFANVNACLASVTKGWHLVNFGGDIVDFPYTADNARQLYSDLRYKWLRDQVLDCVVNDGNFMKRSSSPS